MRSMTHQGTKTAAPTAMTAADRSTITARRGRAAAFGDGKSGTRMNADLTDARGYCPMGRIRVHPSDPRSSVSCSYRAGIDVDRPCSPGTITSMSQQGLSDEQERAQRQSG